MIRFAGRYAEEASRDYQLLLQGIKTLLPTTVTRLALRLDMHRSTLSNFVNAYNILDVADLARILAAMGLSTRDLLLYVWEGQPHDLPLTVRDAWDHGAPAASLTFHLDGVLAVDQAAYAQLPPGTWYLQPTGALRVFFESGGSAASGSTVFDLEYRDGGGAWLSLFPTQTGAVPDHGESVPFDEVQSIGDGLPEVLVVGGPALLRLRVAALPDTPAPAPSGAWANLTVLA